MHIDELLSPKATPIHIVYFQKQSYALKKHVCFDIILQNTFIEYYPDERKNVIGITLFVIRDVSIQCARPCHNLHI